MKPHFTYPRGHKVNGHISIRVEEDLKKRLADYCRAHYHAKISQVVNVAIEQFLENEGWKDSDV